MLGHRLDLLTSKAFSNLILGFCCGDQWQRPSHQQKIRLGHPTNSKGKKSRLKTPPSFLGVLTPELNLGFMCRLKTTFEGPQGPGSAQAESLGRVSEPSWCSQTLTQADGRFPCPAAVGFAGAVLGAPGEVEAALAGVDQGVAQGGQVQGAHVGVGWGLRLPAVVGWRGQGKTVRETSQVGTERVKSDTVTSTGEQESHRRVSTAHRAKPGFFPAGGINEELPKLGFSSWLKPNLAPAP